MDPPNQAGYRVGDKNRSWTDQAAAIEPARSVGKIKNLLGLDTIIDTPVAQIDAVKAGFVVRIRIRSAQVKNIGLDLGEA
jgi:hypothetical protein